MFIKTDDGSVLDESGRVLYFSVERFIRDICEGGCCFVCGAFPSTVSFNDEHILPKWVLKRFDLFKKMIGLPNDSDFRYDKYTIPCCERCNSLMGREIETPISQLVARGHQAVCDHLVKEGPWLFFVWFNLIFIKAHLKDKSLRLHRDCRLPDDRISDHYTWEALHHVHCIARSFYTRCGLSPSVLGSVIVLPAKHVAGFEDFDYGDNYETKSMLIRLGETAFVSVLTDSCAVWNVMADFLRRITGPLSPLQLREVLARASAVYLHLEHLPRFSSSFHPEQDQYVIEAEHPSQVMVNDIHPSVYGTLLESACGKIIDVVEPVRGKEIRGHMREGRWAFLFDDSGEFVRESMEAKDVSRLQE